MKTEIIEPSNNKEPTFPALYRNKQYGTIVLAINHTSGTVVANADDTWRLGTYSDNWLFLAENVSWERLPAGTEIKLIQE